MKTKSSFLSLKSKDLLKGLILVIITALVTGLYQGIQNGVDLFSITFYKPIIMTSILAGLSYIIKNVLTNNDDKFMKKDNSEAKAVRIS